jgi:hypothetical protein
MSKKVFSDVRYENKMKVEEVARKPNGLVRTTVGRVLFNDILSPRMAYYDLSLSSKHLARIIADTYEQLGRRETIELLDRMKELGFRESTRSGLSFATDDLRTPASKEKILAETDGKVEWYLKQYDRGNITERERHNNVVNLWTDATKQITELMMGDLRDDRRKDDHEDHPHREPEGPNRNGRTHRVQDRRHIPPANTGAAGVEQADGQEDAQGAKRDDERWQPQPGDQEPVDKAAGDPERDTDQQGQRSG